MSPRAPRPASRTSRRPQPASGRTPDADPKGLCPVEVLDAAVPPGVALPLVLIDMSMTADGKIASSNRRLASFGSRRDQAHLLELRATADAVMCGARTVDLNRIYLGPGPARYRRLRLRRGLAEYNLRIVASGSGSLDPRAAVFRRRFSPILVVTTHRAPARKLAALRRVADRVCVCGRERIDFRRLLAWLHRQWGVRRLLCEGGGALNGALFEAGLVHQLHLTICPVVLGGRAAPTIADGPGVARLREARRLRVRSSRRVGDELFLVFDVPGASGGPSRSSRGPRTAE